MLFVTYYRWVGLRGKEHVAQLMAKFAERGAPAGEIAHYVHRDGSGGFTIADENALEQLYANSLAYGEYLELETRPVLEIDDALPQILEYLQS